MPRGAAERIHRTRVAPKRKTDDPDEAIAADADMVRKQRRCEDGQPAQRFAKERLAVGQRSGTQPERQRERPHIHEPEDRHERGQETPQRPSQVEREVVTDEQQHQRGRQGERRQRPVPELRLPEVRNVQQ